MNDARQIAAQALKALQLRRQLDSGDLTQEEYLDRLSTLQASQVRSEDPAPPAKRVVETVATKPSQAPTEPPPPKLAPALETLRLHRRRDEGEIAPREPVRLRQVEPAPVTPPAPRPSPAETSAPTPPVETLRLRQRKDEGEIAPRKPVHLQVEPAPVTPPGPRLVPAAATSAPTPPVETLRLRQRKDEGEIAPREPVRLRQVEPIPVTPPAPKPMPAETSAPDPPVETLRLRQRKDEGEMAPPGPERFLHSDLKPAAPPEPKPAPAESIAPVPRRRRPIEIVMSQPLPERSLTMKCPRCDAALEIYDRTAELRCTACGAEVVVRRANCTITLRLAGEAVEEANSILVPPIAAKTGEELQRLTAEAAMVTNVKRATGLLGGLCTAIFAYTGITDMASGQTAVGAIILFCGSVLIATVVCITLHTTRVKAKLAERIRAITADEEFA